MDFCQVQNCSFPPNFKCLCKQPEIKLCDSHIKEHLMLIGNHSILENYIVLVPEKFLLSTHCANVVLKIKDANDKLLHALNKSIQNLMQITMNFIKENKNVEILYVDALNYLNINDKIMKKFEYSPTEEFILKNLKCPNEISNKFNEFIGRQLKNIDLNSKIYESDENMLIDEKKIDDRDKKLDKSKKKFSINDQEKVIKEVKDACERTINEKDEEIKKIIHDRNEKITKIQDEKNNDIRKAIEDEKKRLKEAFDLKIKEKDEEIKEIINKKNEEASKILTEKNKVISDISKTIEENKLEIQKKTEEIKVLTSQKIISKCGMTTKAICLVLLFFFLNRFV